MTIEQLKQGIAELDANIAQGRVFAEQDYDCDSIIAMSEALRDKLDRKSVV